MLDRVLRRHLPFDYFSVPCNKAGSGSGDDRIVGSKAMGAVRLP